LGSVLSVAYVSRFGTLKLLNLIGSQETSRAQLVSDERHVSEVLNRFHLHKRVEQIFTTAYSTVVFEENGVVLCDVRVQAGRYLICSGRGVRSERDAADRHHGFLAKHLIESSSGTGEGRCNGWMGVDYRLYLCSPFVEGQVHADLTRHSSGTTKQATLEIDDHHIGSSDQRLTDSGRSDKKPVLIQAD
jgi:hypothetical protein